MRWVRLVLRVGIRVRVMIGVPIAVVGVRLRVGVRIRILLLERLLATVLARVLVNAHGVVPVSVHPAVVAVAEGPVLDHARAGARQLEDTGALVQHRRSVVLLVVATAIVIMGRVRWV